MIQIIQGFRVSTRDPVDNRLLLSKSEMLKINDNQMPDKYFAICKEDGLLYTYNKAATASEETGKFSVYSSSPIESISINGVTIPISDLGNVDIPLATSDSVGVSKPGAGIAVSEDGTYSIEFNAVDDASIPAEKVDWKDVVLAADNISVIEPADNDIHLRVRLLYKSYSEWNEIKDTFIPLEGEVCLVTIPADTGDVAQEPAVLFKVGNGEHKFSELSYLSALAADVYDWAKKSSLNWDDLDATFKAQLETFIDEHSTKTSTIYRIISDGDYKWKLQKSEDSGTTWVDAEGVMDASAINQKIQELDESLATIAKTGNVNDLIQSDGDIIILDCNV